MQTVDEQPETIHLYVVREKEPKPSVFPLSSRLSLWLSFVVFCALVPYQQPVTRAVIRVPAVLLPLKTFTATTAIIPTGIKVYLATTAYGTLTITNGSVIAQIIPQGFRLGNVVTDSASIRACRFGQRLRLCHCYSPRPGKRESWQHSCLYDQSG